MVGLRRACEVSYRDVDAVDCDAGAVGGGLKQFFEQGPGLQAIASADVQAGDVYYRFQGVAAVAAVGQGCLGELAAPLAGQAGHAAVGSEQRGEVKYGARRADVAVEGGFAGCGLYGGDLLGHRGAGGPGPGDEREPAGKGGVHRDPVVLAGPARAGSGPKMITCAVAASTACS